MMKTETITLDEIAKAATEVADKVASKYFYSSFDKMNEGGMDLSEEVIESLVPLEKVFKSGFKLGFSHCIIAARENLKDNKE